MQHRQTCLFKEKKRNGARSDFWIQIKLALVLFFPPFLKNNAEMYKFPVRMFQKDSRKGNNINKQEPVSEEYIFIFLLFFFCFCFVLFRPFFGDGRAALQPSMSLPCFTMIRAGQGRQAFCSKVFKAVIPINIDRLYEKHTWWMHFVLFFFFFVGL